MLDALVARDDVAIGLLTGNTREGARIKLAHYGLDRYFDFGGFGDNHLERDDVAREALAQALFCGDTLFLMGCGRMFEGTPQQMWTSLSKLKALPPETQVYCGHEYTQANARFALTVEPGNRDLVARAQRVDALRAEGKSTIPGNIGEELLTNPFLRADQPALQADAGAPGDAVATFASIRKRKDNF